MWIRRWDFRWQDRYRYQSPVSYRAAPGCRCGSPTTTLRRIRTTAPVRRSACDPDRARTTRWASCGLKSCRAVPRTRRSSTRFHPSFTACRHRIGRAGRSARSGGRRPQHAGDAVSAGGSRCRGAGAARRGAASDPRDAEAASNLGTVLQAQGRTRRGDAASAQGRESEAEERRCALQSRGRSARGGQPDAAMREFRTAIALNPENAEAHFNLGVPPRAALPAGRGVAHLRRAVEINPRHADGYHTVSCLWTAGANRRGDYGGAGGAAAEAGFTGGGSSSCSDCSPETSERHSNGPPELR